MARKNKGKSTEKTKASQPQPAANKPAESGSPEGQRGEGYGPVNRRDEVGRSGVYPASGPLPPHDADVQPMPSWGQGERGAEGYHDSGSSELWFTQQELEDLGRTGVGRDQVQIGQEVFSADSQRVGHVKDVRDHDIVIARTLAPDVFIPFESIAARTAPTVLVLRLPLSQIDAQV
jgi:hypothetical protein